jgi:UPF0755 protein
MPYRNHLHTAVVNHPERSIFNVVIVLLAGSLALVLLAACTPESMSAAYLQANRDELARPADTTARPVQFVVEPGTPAKVIAQNLEDAGLIKDARLFEAYVRVNNLTARLEAGEFALSPDMTPVEIAGALQNARAASFRVTIPEGWRLEQIADHFSVAGTLDGAAYRSLTAGGVLTAIDGLDPGRYDFLDMRPAGASLEGYLFPDTYDLPREVPDPAVLIRLQLDNFAAQVMPVYRKALAEGQTQMGLHEVVTLASIVEREAVFGAERPAIAQVYLNRLAMDMQLEADPTVQYAMGYQAGTGLWWKTPVFLEEYEGVDSLYNTYRYPGLPPGPIANPGLRSIEAVLYPEEHNYLYFVALPDGTGRHVFARTFAEHLENVRRYRGQ